MNTASSYVPLHLHSNWSLLEGASTIEEYVEAAAGMGLPALALTDTNALYGAVHFYKAAKAARIKPIIGAEITSTQLRTAHSSPDPKCGTAGLSSSVISPLPPGEGQGEGDIPTCNPDPKCGTAGLSSSDNSSVTAGPPASVISPLPPGEGQGEGDIPPGGPDNLLSGRASARALESIDHQNVGRDRIPPSSENADWKGTVPFFLWKKRDCPRRYRPAAHSAVFLVRNSNGYKNLCRLVTARQLDPSFDLVAAAVKYNDGLFVLSSDVQFLRAAAPLVKNLFAELPATFTKKRLREIFSAARELRLPLVASSAARFVSPERHGVHRVLSAIRENALVDNLPDSAVAPPSAYLMSPAEMSAFFKLVPEALANTLRIAAECNFDFTFGKYHFPHTFVPDGETPFSHLSRLAFDGARERYRPLTPAVMNRLARELDVIEKLNFPEYFLIVADIVREARSRGIPIAGRGSAADSLVAYCLGITIVDPIRHDLYFERFMNLSRTDCPDIDLDICWKRRDEVIDYVYEKYGRTRVAMISTYVTYQARSAFRDVARVFGLPIEEIDDLTKRLPHYGAADIEESVRTVPEAADFPINDEPYRTIVSIARQIDSYPRHLGVHLGGLVISDAPLTDYLPLQMATKGIVISQFNMHPVEELGLVKMDLLGQRALSVVFDAAKDVKRLHGVDISFLDLPDRDPAVALLVRRGRTIGGFQIESPGMRNLLQMMRARDKNDLLIGLSLIRPGPAASGMKEHYVRRRRGLEKPFYLHESMRRALSATYGVMLYQEDILKVAQAVAGFDLAVGDELRKAISKGRSPEAMAAIRDKFISGARSRGVDERAASGIYELIRNFAAYSYCKAHAATYAEISYATMFLKAHFPASFHAARINNLAGFYHPRVYLEEARRLGVSILPLDINQSSLEFTTGRAGNSVTDTELQLRTVPGKSVSDTDLSVALLGLFRVRRGTCPAVINNVGQDRIPPSSENGDCKGTVPFFLWKKRDCPRRYLRPPASKVGWASAHALEPPGEQPAIPSPPAGCRGDRQVALPSPLLPACSPKPRRRRGEGQPEGDTPACGAGPDSPRSSSDNVCATAGLVPPCSPGVSSPLPPGEGQGEGDIPPGSPDNLLSGRASARKRLSPELESSDNQPPSPGSTFIRAGFSAVKNLSRRTVDKILSERARRPFGSFADFLLRVDAAKSECESLISAGAFSSLGRTRPECLLELDSFANGGAAALETARSAALPEYSLLEILALEDETMEMTPSAHPMTPFIAAARARGAVPARRIRDFRGKIIPLAGFLVTRRRAPTKKGDYMEFATFEDETDIFEVTLFPDAYRRFGALLRSAGPFFIKGKVEDQYGALTVTAAYLDYLLPNRGSRPESAASRAARRSGPSPSPRDGDSPDASLYAPPAAQLFSL